MPWLDARLPLRFGPMESREAGEAVITDGMKAAAPSVFLDPAPAGVHGTDCACCAPRSTAATALAGLFRDRALSAGPPFRGVLAAVGPAGEAAIRTALASDPVVSARYRLAGTDNA